MSLAKYVQEYNSTDEDGECSKSSGDLAMLEDSIYNPTSPRLMFSAHLSASLTTLTPFKIVIYDVAESNDDDVYNPCTGRFKANLNGLHVFFVTISTASKVFEEDESVCLIHNFHPIDTSKVTILTARKGVCKTKTFRTEVSMRKGDELWIMRISDDKKQPSKQVLYYTSFSGGLLKESKE
ncbi:hypothetical protein MAR_018238 [Mya arenaria]|uniref:C1q domain-containing protein n=1 Tax=Mya arenaria TaxID=6604 RepID=A0ABY7EEH5_MYAAR|nr:hypothetical protein MAR_018238 [Mya arenaria]